MEKIKTLHPAGKQGVNISRAKYDVIKEAILTALAAEELTFTGLAAAVSDQLGGQFDGSISWYVVSVKLDLEARGVVERVGRSPQRLRLVNPEN